MRKCDANDVPDSLLEGGTTASLIALRLSRGQTHALDDAAKLASASARDIDRDAPLASALSKRSRPPWTLYHPTRACRTFSSMLRTRTPHWSPTRRQGRCA